MNAISTLVVCHMIFGKALSLIEQRIESEYQVSTLIKHKGERGRQREEILRTILDEFLPESYGIATGEIIPFENGNISPQIDIVIYDKLKMPILGKKNALQQIPLEATYAVIEVKSVLDGAALEDAARKFELIREMPRCPYHFPVKEGMHRGPSFYVFGFTSKVSLETCKTFIADNSVNRDICCHILDKGIAIWLGVEGDYVPIALDLRENDVFEHSTSLSCFIATLMNDLQFIDIGHPNFLRLIWQ